jgi:CelD/BcsL family acetyltransferase involved in cellulose biosynthesis
VSFILVWEDDRIVGMVPVSFRRMNRFGLFLPVAEAFGGRGDYSAPAVAGSWSQELVNALLEAAILVSRRSGVFVLPNIPEEAGLHTWVEQFLDARGYSYVQRESKCPIIQLQSTLEETYQTFSKSLRTDLRRQSKRIRESHGPLSFGIVESKEEAARLLPLFFEMHDKRWLNSGHRSTFGDASVRAFYARKVTKLWDSGLHFSTLSCGDRIVAFHLGIVSNGFLLYYKPTYDFDLHSYSPGKLLLDFLVRHGVAEGWKGIDLLQGAEAYKNQWATSVARTFSYTVRCSPRSISYWWLTEGRPWAERRLGSLYNRFAVRFAHLRSR